jgi:hypothetical protein
MNRTLALTRHVGWNFIMHIRRKLVDCSTLKLRKLCSTRGPSGGVNTLTRKSIHRLNRSLMKPCITVKNEHPSSNSCSYSKTYIIKIPTSMYKPTFLLRAMEKNCTWFGENRPRKFTRLAVLNCRTAARTTLSYSDNFTSDQEISICASIKERS